MVLVVYADANRGVSFCKKPFTKDSYVKHFCEVAEMFNQKQRNFEFFEDFKGDWQNVDTVLMFVVNNIYPATEFFKFPADKKFVLRNFKNIQGQTNLITKEVYRREEV